MNQTEELQIETNSYPKIAPQDFKKEDYIHLWQYFENGADMLKDRLSTMTTWLFGLNSALLGFVFGTPVIAFDSVGSAVRAPAFVLALALAGCVLCLYSFVLIYDYGKHIRRNWDRADRLSAELPLVEYGLKGKAAGEDRRNPDPGNRSTTDEKSDETMADNNDTSTNSDSERKPEKDKRVEKLLNKLRSAVKQIAMLPKRIAILPSIAKSLMVFTFLYLVAFLAAAAFAL